VLSSQSILNPDFAMIDSSAWQDLLAHHAQTGHQTMRTRFADEPDRFQALSLQACGLLLDYSKNCLGSDTVALLLQLARERGVEARRDAMFAGKLINGTEQRAALHTALRAGEDAPWVDQEISLAVTDVLRRMAIFSAEVRNGSWQGYDGRAIRTVVHIGIGGSDLGPRMACEALSGYGRTGLDVRFVANVDAHELLAAVEGLDAATTLFIVASKTFTTAETMLNARSARDWCLAAGVPQAALWRHFVAVSCNETAVREFGIDPSNMFPLWDWVGGRYSLCSAIGLPLALQSGMDVFLDLHAGARAMDQHFREAPLQANMPVLLALVGIWNINVLNIPTLSIAPYHHLLSRLPLHLQQLEMESNGKSVNEQGKRLAYSCAPVIWGQAGSNGQHAYFQWLHQSSDPAAVDFIAVAQTSPGHAAAAGHQRALLANCLAQSEALMRGKTLEEVNAELCAGGMSANEADGLAPHKVFPGNRPSNTLLMPRLDAYHLGALLALYEHKVMVQGAIWGINSFDQWGVEWGKSIARTLEQRLDGTSRRSATESSSTSGLIAAIRDLSHSRG
jgi:glucose-6-phosphate isomerase